MQNKIDPTELIHFIEQLIAVLPAQSRIAREVEHSTTVWLALVVEVLDQLQRPEHLRFRQALQEWLQQRQPSDDFVPPINPALVGRDSVVLQQLPSAPESPQVEQLSPALALMHTVWQLATATDKTTILAGIQAHQDQAPFATPRPTDIIIYGTAYTDENIPPLWVGAATTFPLFATCFPGLASDTQLWLVFGTVTAGRMEPEPTWLGQQPELRILWQRWHDLRCWAILAPEATVFVNEKCEDLSQSREAVTKMLMNIHRNFEYALLHPEQNLIGVNLHKVYSAFYQFLFPEDLDARKVAKNVFARLRMDVRNNLDGWLRQLQVTEDHAAGPPRKEEYIPNVRNDTQKNIRLASRHLLLSQSQVRESQVVYWLRPKWRQAHPSRDQSPDLLGSTLYVFD